MISPHRQRYILSLVILIVSVRGQNKQWSGVESGGSRQFPDRSGQYVRSGQELLTSVSQGASDVARSAVNQFQQQKQQLQQQYANSSLSNQDPGAIFRQYARQRDELERPTTTTTVRPETTTFRRPGIQPQNNQQQQQQQNQQRDPFDDPNRYLAPQIQDISQGVRYVNGIPFRETTNIKDRYGNRYDSRPGIGHQIPGEYDANNDPRFSDPNFQDPRNVPKYDNNIHQVPNDRFDTKYRYYERFPDRQRDKIQDPNYDPRWDTNEPHASGVLGGWLPELQGECRPGCENLPRDVTVTTNYGRVNGFYVYLYDGPRVPLYERPGRAHTDKVKKKVSVFLGIPYAEAPTGKARLMPPRPHRGWQTWDAVDWAPVCPQPIKYVGATKNSPLMDENCLFLNVFSPETTSTVSQLFPIMIYIHGGHFFKGSANEFPGHQLAANGQVVVVAFNYRLGALGFLSTGDHHAPGNYGLLDMALAIKWVYDNADAFQGDRNKITLFGPDAGAAAAGILAVMPKTRQMVRRVIAISGSPLADWAVFNDKFRAMNVSRVYGERIGCTVDQFSSWELVDCIKTGKQFHELSNIEFKPEIGTWPWAPVVQKNISVPEDGFQVEWKSDDFMAIPELVSVLYENQQYHPNFQYMTGVARDDASYLLYGNKTIAPDYTVGWDFFDVMVKDHINQYNYTLNPQGIFNSIKFMYTYYPDPNNKTHIREEFVRFWTDFYFTAPQDAIVKTLVRNGVDTYMYVQNTTVQALKLPWWRHIEHNLEHYFISGAPFMDSVYYPVDVQVSRPLWTEGDRNMSQFFIYAYANFSWYGNPTPQNILGVHWDMTIKEEIQRYLALNTTENSTTLWNYRQKECAFWTEYLPSVIGYITPTYPPTTEFWWEPNSPLQVGFWSISSVSLFLLVLVVIFFLLWRNANRQSKIRYGDAAAGSLASLKHHPDHFDHIHDDKGRISPALSNRSGFTERSRLENHDGVSLRSFTGAPLQPSPSTHSLRSLGLTRLGGPASLPQPHSRQPSLVMNGRQPQPIMNGLPVNTLTPAVTPNLHHRPMPGPPGPMMQMTQMPPQMSQAYTVQGVAVGPGEIPNNAGPFINGGLHDLSNDSLQSQQSGGLQFDPRGGPRRGPQPQTMDSSLESGVRFPSGPPPPMSQPKTPVKLVPGRMSQTSDNKGRPPPKSPGPGPRPIINGGPASRPESRAASRATRGGFLPSTAV